MEESRRGALLGAGAYLLWGILPVYWPLMEPTGALEVLAHRVIWSLVVVAVLVGVLGRGRELVAVVRDTARVVRLLAAACFVAANWGLYIYGVSSGQVVETSLGYFVNPLVTVLLGVLVLGERLRPLQWSALGAATVAVLVLSVENGRPPLIALGLAGSFAVYGLIKKTVGVGPVEGLAVETAVLAPLAAIYLLVQAAHGTSTAMGHGVGHALLLITTGLVTMAPLLLFAGAAQRVTMTTLGLLQYIAPSMQFLLGVLLFHEPMGQAKLLGFVLVWLALAVFSYDLLAQHRRRVGARVLAAA